MARPLKSKELKAIQGTLRPDRDRVPQKRVLQSKELPSPQLELQERGKELFRRFAFTSMMQAYCGR